jgi:hypothetical protein
MQQMKATRVSRPALQPVPVRLVFPAEALGDPVFRAAYEQIGPLGDQELDAEQQIVTFLHPGADRGRLPALEALLKRAGFPYNLVSDPSVDPHQAEEIPQSQSLVIIWRPTWENECVVAEREASSAAARGGFQLNIREACVEFLYGQTSLALA